MFTPLSLCRTNKEGKVAVPVWGEPALGPGQKRGHGPQRALQRPSAAASARPRTSVFGEKAAENGDRLSPVGGHRPPTNLPASTPLSTQRGPLRHDVRHSGARCYVVTMATPHWRIAITPDPQLTSGLTPDAVRSLGSDEHEPTIPESRKVVSAP